MTNEQIQSFWIGNFITENYELFMDWLFSEGLGSDEAVEMYCDFCEKADPIREELNDRITAFNKENPIDSKKEFYKKKWNVQKEKI